MIARLLALIARRRTPEIDVQFFHVLYCALILIQFLYGFGDQYLFFRLQSPSPPSPALDFIPMPALDGTGFLVAGALFAICLGLSVFGVRTRGALLAAAALYFVYFSQIRHLSYVVRKTNFVPITLVLLCFMPGIERSGVLALGRSIRQAWQRRDSTAPKVSATVAEWPLRLYRLLLGVMYLSAAVSKLRTSGFSWGGGGGLQTFMFQNYLWNDLPITKWLAEHPDAVAVVAISGLVFESTFWVVAFWPRSSLYFALFGIAFHVANEAVMTIQYSKYFLPSYAIFVNSAVLSSLFQSRRLRETPRVGRGPTVATSKGLDEVGSRRL